MEKEVIVNIVDKTGIIKSFNMRDERFLYVPQYNSPMYYDYEFISSEYKDLLSIEQQKSICEMFSNQSMLYRSDYYIHDKDKQKLWNSIVKLTPKCKHRYVYRYLHMYDNMDMNIGETLTIGHSLTTTSVGRKFRKPLDYVGKYIIRCKSSLKTKAHDVSVLWTIKSEKQVNFEDGATFLIDDIKNVHGKHYIYMHEI